MTSLGWQSARYIDRERIVSPDWGVCILGRTRIRDAWISSHTDDPSKSRSSNSAAWYKKSSSLGVSYPYKGLPMPSDASSAIAHSSRMARQMLKFPEIAWTGSCRALTKVFQSRIARVGGG